MIRCEGFPIKDIERGNDAARSHSLDQRGLVHKRTSGSVDQHGARFHPRDFVISPIVRSLGTHKAVALMTANALKLLTASTEGNSSKIPRDSRMKTKQLGGRGEVQFQPKRAKQVSLRGVGQISSRVGTRGLV